jgi:hypothetical protein
LPAPGEWVWTTVSEDPALDGHSGVYIANPPSRVDIARNPNLRGHVRVGSGGRLFSYADETPFFWLGDTNWAFGSLRCGVGDGQEGPFHEWLRDRQAKGFTAVNVEYARRVDRKNEGGYPWGRPSGDAGATADGRAFAELNPEYFRYIDERIHAIWESGLMIAGPPTWIGKGRDGSSRVTFADAVALTRYVLARYGAYNIVFALSGEYQYSYTENRPRWTTEDWKRLGSLVKTWNAYRHPVSIHPSGRQELDEPAEWPPEAHQASSGGEFHNEGWLDHNWLQTGHRHSLMWRVPQRVLENYARTPAKPVVLSEGWYEGTHDRHGCLWADDEHVRWQVWAAFLSGAAGFVYGHGSIWPFYDPLDPETDGPHLASTTHWRDALAARGAAQMRHVRDFFDCVGFGRLRPHPGSAHSPGIPCREPNEWCVSVPFCATKEDGTIIVYLPYGCSRAPVAVRLPHGFLSDRSTSDGAWFDPKNGGFTAATATISARPDASQSDAARAGSPRGAAAQPEAARSNSAHSLVELQLPRPPEQRDWVFVYPAPARVLNST